MSERKKGLEALLGKWPGDETDEQIEKALDARKLPRPMTETRILDLEKALRETVEALEALVVFTRWHKARRHLPIHMNTPNTGALLYAEDALARARAVLEDSAK